MSFDASSGTTYRIAIDGAGGGVSGATVLNWSRPATPVPGAPVMGTATSGNGQASVSFSAPTNDGGSPVTSHTVTSSPWGITATGAASPITVAGLTNGTTYTFTVRATNAVGHSPESAPSNPVTPVAPATVPVARVMGTATAGNGQASVSFSAPTNDGGSPVTSYTVTSSPGGITATGAASPITVAGLTNGTTYTFTVRATNAVGHSAESAPSNAVTPVAPSVAPSVTSFTAAVEPAAVNTAVAASAAFSDPDANKVHTCSFDWGDGTPAGVVAGATSPCSASHSYPAAGIYTLAVTVTDAAGAFDSEVFQYVVVYDPAAGFVTGGGRIDSPAGAYSADPTLSGRASFGFVSRYRPGANRPEGNTQFQFHAANFDFRSSVYDWLVVSGPKAQYEGSGTINGAGDYGFLLTANDGQQNGGGEVDRLRIRIWDKASSSGATRYWSSTSRLSPRGRR